jgi:putative ABC transport system permease protein
MVMKYFRIIWKNCMRNKRRTILTVLSVGFSLFLVTFLRTLMVEFSRTNETPTAVRRIAVHRSTSLQEDMPEAYRKRIETVQDVDRVVGMDWFGGIYKEPKNFFANFAVEHEDFFDVFPEVRLDTAAKQAFFAQRTAAFCGVKLAERFGWKVGDKVTLLGTIYPADLEFILVGFYTSAVDERTFYFRRDYMQEALGKPGKVGVFFVLARSLETTPRVIERIDSMFRNTDAETLSETERAFQAGFQTMMGNVQGLVLSIMSVVVFMILLVVGNAMAMSIRERSHEIAIMKSLGFQNESLIGILLSESLLISLMGGIVGCFGAIVLFRAIDMTRLSQGFLQQFQVEPLTLALGFGVALGVGVISGGLPAVHVVRLTVSDGLRRVG